MEAKSRSVSPDFIMLLSLFCFLVLHLVLFTAVFMMLLALRMILCAISLCSPSTFPRDVFREALRPMYELLWQLLIFDTGLTLIDLFGLSSKNWAPSESMILLHDPTHSKWSSAIACSFPSLRGQSSCVTPLVCSHSSQWKWQKLYRH